MSAKSVALGALVFTTMWASSAAAAPEDASGPTVTLGASAWHGDFGTGIDTDISAVIFNASQDVGPLRLSATAPYMRIEGPTAVFVGIGATPLFVSPNALATTKRDGLGDVTLGASLPLSTGQDSGLDVRATARVKLPTASKSSGITTGETDYSFGVEASKTFGRFVPSISATYRDFGASGAWRLQDGFAVSASAAFILPRRITAVISYDYSEGASEFIDDSNELVAGLSVPVGKARLTAFAAKGLSNGAADISGGVSLGRAF